MFYDELDRVLIENPIPYVSPVTKHKLLFTMLTQPSLLLLNTLLFISMLRSFRET